MLAQKLKEDLQNGSLMLADLHAIQLRLALAGALSEEMSAKASALEQVQDPDKPEPELTGGLVPDADKLIQALDDLNWSLAKKYSEGLAVKIHAQHELYVRKQVKAGEAGDVDEDRYFNLSHQLHESLGSGDITTAAALAPQVQATQEALGAKKKLPASAIGRNVYDINDALGRAAFLKKDYLSACDYLLKAADTPGRDPALITFGPDLWLAQALLKAGYRDAVLTFLERCKAFWSRPRLDEWISVLQNGGSPDFGPNIFSKNPILSN
jgi:hypothetical protein